MGENIVEIGESRCEDIRKRGRPRKIRGSTGSESATDSRTSGTGTDTSGTAAGTAAGTATEEKTGISGLPVLDEKTKTKTPKRVNRKKNNVDDKSVKDILATISYIIASRPGMEYWQLTPDEINKLSQPIANLISKSEFMSNASEHSDAIALTTACFTIFMPRLVLTGINIKNKKNKQGVMNNAGNNKMSSDSGQGRTDEKRQNKTSGSRNNGNVTGTNENAGDSELYIGMPFG